LFDADFCMWVFQVLRMAGQIEAWKSLEKKGKLQINRGAYLSA